jgi:predicted nucleotidyltransferase
MSAVDPARLEPVFAADARVRFAYVFGSVAEGTDRPSSDVDLAVSVHPRGALLDDARLHDAIVGALGREDVDLVVLEDAPLWLA